MDILYYRNNNIVTPKSKKFFLQCLEILSSNIKDQKVKFVNTF